MLGLSALTARAQKSATDEVRRLQARMYKLYASQDYDAFISVTDSLKTAAEKAGDERTFYKAWANQVLFSSNRGRRNRAMEIAREMQQHAINRGNKFGIYNGTHVAAYTHQQMENLPEAIKEYKKAIAYLHEYLPNESAASSLLELAKIAYLRNNPDKCISYAEQAIHEQNLNPLHRLNALSLMCIASADSAVYHPRSNDYRTDFNHFYSEREKAKKDYGRDDIDIYAVIDPAREVGGDLYDFMLQNDRLYFCIGDVSGKGIPASLFMSAVVNLFRMLAKEGFPPEYIATRLNETLTENNENGMFCTLFIGEIDLNTGKLHYCNAGHNPPVIMARQLNSNAPTEPTLLEMETNAPIGLWPDLEFVGEEIGNIKDRPLFFYTDGLSEAEDANQQQYGEERLLDILGGQAFDSARLTIERIQDSVRRHVGSAPQSDDLTMLCIKCK